MLSAQDIPFDVFPLIVGHLNDRVDLYNATLVSRLFYRASIPILYEDLDSRLISSHKGLIVHHPAQTLLQKPELARYVHSVKESGTLHGAPQTRAQNIHILALNALRLCTSLRSFSWVDDNFMPDETFMSILEVLKALPLRDLTIRTFKNLGAPVWDLLNQFEGLKSVSIFCMEGPPRILQGWSETLSPTLTHLELGRCSGVPLTILLSVFMHLQSLTYLRIRGAPSTSLPYLIATLPRLRSLDTDFTDTGSARAYAVQLSMPALEKLTLRAGSVDAGGPVGLWGCAQLLLSAKSNSLKEFRLQAFATLGETSVPRPFILFMAQMHGGTLKRFLVGATLLMLDDVACICDKFPKLEELSCAIPNADTKGIRDAIVHAYNLRAIRLNVQIFPISSFQAPVAKNDNFEDKTTSDYTSIHIESWSKSQEKDSDPRDIGRYSSRKPFTILDARDMMLRPRSRLRNITVGSLNFKGEWVYDPSSGPDYVRFEVEQVQVENSRGEA